MKYHSFGYMSFSVGSSGVKYSNINGQNVLYYETHSKKLQVKMHQHVMMLHAKYTILYIKVQCHNELMNL